MSNQETIVKTYRGSQSGAAAAFKRDAASLVAKGYHPVNQSWAPGTYGCGAFILALLLCFIIIGFLIFIYMLIVKPAGTLTVTYARQVADAEKSCPRCAERVKQAAKVCRFCGHEFGEETHSVPAAQPTAQGPTNPTAHAIGKKLGEAFSKKR